MTFIHARPRRSSNPLGEADEIDRVAVRRICVDRRAHGDHGTDSAGVHLAIRAERCTGRAVLHRAVRNFACRRMAKYCAEFVAWLPAWVSGGLHTYRCGIVVSECADARAGAG